MLLHWMTGTVLGVLCAGLLLVMHSYQAAAGDGWPASPLARLLFLIAFGGSFGLGSVLTGAMFSAFERV